MARTTNKKPKREKDLAPTGLALVDGLPSLEPISLGGYVSAVSEYVRAGGSSALTDGQKKAAQIRLSLGLAKVLLKDLEAALPGFKGIAGEHEVAGGLRSVNVDVCETHPMDGLRLAIEIKPVNLAVGRALWNRFGDIRTVAVNIHLKFPFAVVGGVLVIPTTEYAKSKGEVVNKSTVHLINRAVDRLKRAGGRLTEGDPAHLLEGVAVLVYDPETGLLDPLVPPAGSGLRWDEFVAALTTAYEARFET